MRREARPARRRALAFRLGAVALAVLASAILAEIALRITYGAPLPNRRPLLLRGRSPTRGWQMIPHQDHYTYDRPVRLNELGLRGPALAAKAAGETRVLALGDSLVYGQGVLEEDTIPARLERALAGPPGPAAAGATAGAATPHPVRVVNAGHRGYATHEELALLEELGPRIEPDVVVLYWYWNDVLEPDIAETYAWLTRTGPVPFDTAHVLEGLDLWRWRARQVLRASALVVFLHDAVQALAFEPPQGPALEQAWQRLDSHLNRLVALGRERGFRLLVALVPDRGALTGAHFSVPMTERVEELCRRHGVPTVPLLGAVRAAYDRLGVLPVVAYDGHWAGPANEAMAARTASRLLELGFVAPPPASASQASAP